jgi:NAD(P)-dependent dehydrogenase (short-subunit alcohol dehydrogenase family)
VAILARILATAALPPAARARRLPTTLGCLRRPPVALVTGANRGLGLEVVRQLAELGWTTLLGARDPAKGVAAARSLSVHGGEVRPLALDVVDPDGVARAAEEIGRDHGRLDLLVNNAAILYDTWQRGVDAGLDVVREALETNLLGAWRVAQAVRPLCGNRRTLASSTCRAGPARWPG